MRRKWEFIILGAAIAALALYIGLRRTDRIRYRLPDIAALQALDRITVDRSDTVVTLERRGERWLILPEGFAADPQIASDMAAAVSELELTDLVSVSGDYGRYGLDEEQRITVTAQAAGSTAREIYVGKSTGRRTFVLLEQDKRVFAVQKNLRSIFERDKEALRDRTVLSFIPTSVDELTIRSGGFERRFARAVVPQDSEEGEEERILWRSDDGVELDGGQADLILGRLSALQCIRFLAPEDIGGAPQLSVELKGTATYRLSAYEPRDDGYPASSSGSDDPFLLSKWIVDDLKEKLVPGS